VICKVIIAGSRTVSPTVEQIDDAIARLDPDGLLLVPSEWTHVICGMAKGADLAGMAWALARGKEVIRCPITPRMVSQHGKYLAPKMRNREMAMMADAALLFWDAKSSGTADMCIRMNVRDKPVRTIPWAPTIARRKSL
jgi:hypothetical protein